MMCVKSRICQINSSLRRALLAVLTVFTLIDGICGLAQAQTFSTLYSFQGQPDGSLPRGPLVRDGAGNLYGTTELGGRFCIRSAGCGTVFKIDAAGNETVLHSFRRQDGSPVSASLLTDPAGNLYGVSTVGGDLLPGTVFEVSPTGMFRVLHTFNGSAGDGIAPTGLMRDTQGNLFGTTERGGAFNLGTIFEIDAAGNESVLYSFGGPDGAYPRGGVIMDTTGNLIGTTFQGGMLNAGTLFVFQLSGIETVLYDFSDAGDGGFPIAGLFRDAGGNFYGTTGSGGNFNAGTVFKWAQGGTLITLHSFRPALGDGESPIGGVIVDSSGNVFGTTEYGGTSGFGTVFRVDSHGTETVLHSFAGGVEGQGPFAGLVEDGAANLYGTTGAAPGNGTVFKISLH